MKFAGYYGVFVGLAMIGQWAFFLLSGRVPELSTEPWAIGFHLAAEGTTAAMLIAAGLGILRGAPWGRKRLLLAAGMVLYAMVNAAGYFAQAGQWAFVGMFGVLLLPTALACHVVSVEPRPRSSTSPPAGASVRPTTAKDAGWIRKVLVERWGGPEVAVGTDLHDASRLPGLVAERSGERCGLVTWRTTGADCRIVTLDALERRQGIGKSLIAALGHTVREGGCARLVVTTTNDNVEALRFYQRRGFRLAALRPGAIDAARRDLKPSIPETGESGIAIRDEIELHKEL